MKTKYSRIAANVRAIMDERGMGMVELSAAMGRQQGWLAKVLSSGSITLRELLRMSDILDVELSEILKQEKND